MPSLDGATDWINGSLETINIKTDKPTLVYFWSVSCGICKETMPKLKELKAKYEPLGLQTIAIHMPRYESDSNLETVKETIKQLDLIELCAVDNQHLLKDAFKNSQGWVPIYFLFDGEGKMKSRAAGEHGVGVLKTALERLFPETVANAAA